MRRILALLILLLPACGGPPPIELRGPPPVEPAAEVTSALEQVNWYIGSNSSVLPFASPLPIFDEWIQPPFPPAHPSTQSQLIGSYTLDNNGSTAAHNLNRIQLYWYLVNGAQASESYYVATADVYTYTPSFGGVQNHYTTPIVMTFHQRQQIHMSWDGTATWGTLKFELWDLNQNQFVDTRSVQISFDHAGAMPNRLHSAYVMFSKDPNNANGCNNDFPNYDDNALDNGHIYVWTNYGYSPSAMYWLEMSAPLAASVCSLHATNYVNAFYTNIEWHLTNL